METDIHLIRTDKKIEDVKKILKENVFGNYDVIDVMEKESEFGIFLFSFDKKYIALKLDYNFYNYDHVSFTIMSALGRELKAKRYWIIGTVLEYSKAFVRHYEYLKKTDSMIFVEELQDVSGSFLTPKIKERWKFDSHNLWAEMMEKMNWEIARQCLNGNTHANRKFASDFKEIWEKNWKEKYGSLDKIGERICETMYFMARQEIEQYRTDPKDVKVEQVKLGKIVLERNQDGDKIKTVIPNNQGELKQ